MGRELRYVDPNRRRGWFTRVFAAFSATRVGKFLSRTIVWRLDPILLRVSGGRIGMGATLPTALLETTGAKSGEPRRNAVIYFHDGERVTIIASRAGDTRHPAWFHNLRANPDVTFGGIPMRATVVGDEAERRRIWALADSVFAPFADYRRDTAKVGREIPIVQLTERA
jgi:deazaflavin-dependent oxidoreductase (nitroreductase family)